MKFCDRTQKICKKHGQLTYEDIYLTRHNDKEPYRISVYCFLCIKENRKKAYNKSNIFNKNEMVLCKKCKETKPIIEFVTSELKSIWPNCRKCKNDRSKQQYRKHHLRATYNITNEQYDEMLLQQDNKCKICNKEERMPHQSTNKIKGLSVDHNHETGKIRGLLCANCNLMIGHAIESSCILRNGANYLDSHA